MKNEVLHSRQNSTYHDSQVLTTLRSLEAKFEKEVSAKQSLIKWQNDEMRRLQGEIDRRDSMIDELNAKFAGCRSHVEGYRQLINKLITDVDKLQQNVDWYKRTYESRSLFGVIKDKLKHVLR